MSGINRVKHFAREGKAAGQSVCSAVLILGSAVLILRSAVLILGSAVLILRSAGLILRSAGLILGVLKMRSIDRKSLTINRTALGIAAVLLTLSIFAWMIVPFMTWNRVQLSRLRRIGSLLDRSKKISLCRCRSTEFNFFGT